MQGCSQRATHVGGKDNVLSGTVWLEVKQSPHIRPWTQQFTLIVERSEPLNRANFHPATRPNLTDNAHDSREHHIKRSVAFAHLS